ncbi:MAG: SDR family oxidoreductase [Ignavibacteriales bacterium]|nr:SDR family oxidoreductase [Ignavibacteriales bacterium]
MDLKQKYGEWALVTGASSGIGEEFARRFASEGLNIILLARRKDRLEKLSEELKLQHKIKTVVCAVDLSTDSFLEEIKRCVGEREVGILVNNAGFGSTGEFVNASLEHEAKMVKVNCLAPIILTHHFVEQMRALKKGAIIFLGSTVAFQPTPFMTTYSATKAFNLFMGDALWWELKKYNIDVLSLNPGGTATEFQRIASSDAGPIPRTTKNVVRTALKTLGRKPTVVDGLYNKLLSVSSRFGTRRLTVGISGLIAKKLYSAR